MFSLFSATPALSVSPVLSVTCTDWNNGIDTLSENSDILQSDLAGVRQASDALLDLTSGVSNELTGDLLAINDRINSTYKLLEDLMNGVTDQGVKYLFSDISDRNPVCITDGRTLSCTNHGSIYGDINVAVLQDVCP